MGALAILNIAPVVGVTRQLLQTADVIIGNQGEVECLCREHQMPLDVLARSFNAIFVETAGALGVRAATPSGEVIAIAGLSVVATDAVGAGDCFSAALTVALAEGMSIASALRFANGAAALKVQAPGARSTPLRQEVDDLLRGQ